MHQGVVGGGHFAFADVLAGMLNQGRNGNRLVGVLTGVMVLMTISQRPCHIREVVGCAAFVNMMHYISRHWGDLGIPRPHGLVAVAVVAGPPCDGFGVGVRKYHRVGGGGVAMLGGDKLD